MSVNKCWHQLNLARSKVFVRRNQKQMNYWIKISEIYKSYIPIPPHPPWTEWLTHAMSWGWISQVPCPGGGEGVIIPGPVSGGGVPTMWPIPCCMWCTYPPPNPPHGQNDWQTPVKNIIFPKLCFVDGNKFVKTKKVFVWKVLLVWHKTLWNRQRSIFQFDIQFNMTLIFLMTWKLSNLSSDGHPNFNFLLDLFYIEQKGKTQLKWNSVYFPNYHTKLIGKSTM